MGFIKADRRLAVAIAVGLPALAGALTALVCPRGPITTGQPLGVMIAGLAVGLGSGFALRFRRTVLAAPVVYVAGWVEAPFRAEMESWHDGAVFG